jgi:hypothetical protein
MATDHSNWMGTLLAEFPNFGKIPINQIAMLGAHDAATYGMGTSSRTQNLDIAAQLQQGVRYFDFRPMKSGSGYKAHHTLPSDNAFEPIFAQLRSFLQANPQEILILKFQNYKDFGHDDYWGLVQLLEQYVSLVTADAPENHPNKQTLDSLLAAGKRVYVFFDTENVPTDDPRIWEKVWPFQPSTEKLQYALWDPYWHDVDASLANDDAANVAQKWWPWHEQNRQTWAQEGVFVMQMQMQMLGPFSGDSTYFNKAERTAKATWNEDRDAQGKLICNNARNIEQCVRWLREGKSLNVLFFDYVEYGGLCDALVACYRESLGK